MQEVLRLASLTALVTLSLTISAPAAAQTVPAHESPAASVNARLETLEQQINSLRETLQALSRGTPEGGVDARLEALDQQIRVLARTIELEREQAAEAAREAPTVRAGRDGFALRSADDAFQFRLRGYLHSDNRIYLQDRQQAADTVVLRRVRPIFEATLFRQFDFRVMPDFGGGTTVLQDAYLDARFHPLFRVRAGKFKSPVGFERLASATELLFVERALPTALAPNRDLGIAVHGDWRTGRVIYMGGVFNGVADGASLDSDDQDGKDVAGRLFLQPFSTSARAWAKGIGFGVSGSYGIQRGTVGAPNLPTMRTSGQLPFFRYRSNATDAGTVVADGRHARVSAHGAYYIGPAGLVVEHILSSQRVRRSASSIDVNNRAWQIGGSYVLTGEAASARGVTPARAFDRANGSWGAFELAARFSALDVDDDAFPFFANPASAARRANAWAIGTNWYLNPNVRITVDFERTMFKGGATSGNRAAENDILSRFQIAF